MNFYRVKFESFKFTLISLGSLLGVILRLQINNYFITNSIGSLIIGLALGIGLKSYQKLFVCVGFCGTLTIFSGWMFNCLSLFSSGDVEKSLFILLSSIISGLTLAFLGFVSGEKIRSRYL